LSQAGERESSPRPWVEKSFEPIARKIRRANDPMHKRPANTATTTNRAIKNRARKSPALKE
jgi:hypothetical protein